MTKAKRLRLVTVTQKPLPRDRQTVRGAADAAQVAEGVIGDRDREHCLVLHLDGRHHLISAEIISIGDLNSAPVHPREVFKGAILANAAAIVFAHNHPSGDVSPSPQDEGLCERLRLAGDLIGIPLLDFLIVSKQRGFWSRAQDQD